MFSAAEKKRCGVFSTVASVFCYSIIAAHCLHNVEHCLYSVSVFTVEDLDPFRKGFYHTADCEDLTDAPPTAKM